MQNVKQKSMALKLELHGHKNKLYISVDLFCHHELWSINQS